MLLSCCLCGLRSAVGDRSPQGRAGFALLILLSESQGLGSGQSYFKVQEAVVTSQQLLLLYDVSAFYATAMSELLSALAADPTGASGVALVACY